MKTVTATKPINPLVTKRYLCMCVGIFVCINVHHRRFSPLATRHLFLGFSFSISFFSLIILSYEKKKKKHTHTQCVCGFDHIDRYFIIDNFDSLTPIYACLLIVSLDLLLLSAHFNWFFLRSLWFFFFVWTDSWKLLRIFCALCYILSCMFTPISRHCTLICVDLESGLVISITLFLIWLDLISVCGGWRIGFS